MAYIYQIINDINGKIYIGKTENNIKDRFAEHCRESKTELSAHRPLYRAMNKYGIEHFHIELIEETDEPEIREQFWIEQKGSFHNGYNATLGGDGAKYIDYDQVICEYATLQNMSEVSKKLGICEDTVKKILDNNHIPIISSQEIAKQKYSIAVDMLTLGGEYLQTFYSLNEAARYMVDKQLTGCKLTTIKQHINEVCRGRRKTAAKFKWQYSK